MKKVLVTLLLAALLPLSSAFAADDFEDIDVASLSCKDAMEMDGDEVGNMIIWADGYLSGKYGYKKITAESIARLSGTIAAYCALNPGKSFMDAINAVKR